jgi:site-specific DNA-methyltransferase (adenine-specific)
MNTQKITHYKTNTLDLRLMDCMELMKEYPDKHFDLAIVDPPYGINWLDQVQNQNKGKNWKVHEYKPWDQAPPPPKYFAELRRLSKHQIIWGGNYMMENLKSTPCWVIWDKMQEFDGAVFEMAWTSFDSPAKAFRMSRIEAYANQDKFHPTQKPVKLYLWLLAKYAKEGMKILDTHLGSMSHAIAAHYSGVHLTGCELDPDYFAAGIARVKRETAQMDMFAGAPKEKTIETPTML